MMTGQTGGIEKWKQERKGFSGRITAVEKNNSSM